MVERLTLNVQISNLCGKRPESGDRAPLLQEGVEEQRHAGRAPYNSASTASLLRQGYEGQAARATTDGIRRQGGCIKICHSAKRTHRFWFGKQHLSISDTMGYA